MSVASSSAPPIDDAAIRRALNQNLLRIQPAVAIGLGWVGAEQIDRLNILEASMAAMRLALAKLMLKEPNFLILDEPTNHLDIQSRQALEQALATYPGAMLVVSHDRYFLDRVMDELLVFEPDSVSRWPGNYSSYRAFKEEQAAAEQTLPNKTAGTKRRPAAPSAFKRKKQEKTTEMIETAIHNKEAELAQLELDLNDERIFTDQTKIIDIGNAYSKVKKELEALYKDWEVVAMEIEGL